MNFGLLFFQLLPLLLYIAFNYWKGFKAGIIAAIAACLFMVSWDYATSGTVDQISLAEASLIIVLGMISLRMNNERFFKFQPTVLSFTFAAIFAYFEFKHEPVMVRMIPEIEKLFVTGEEPTGYVKIFLDNIHTPETLKAFARVSTLLIFVFLGHSLIMAHAALNWSTARWFAWRFSIYPAMLVASWVAVLIS